MRFTVFGSSGYIGSHLATYLGKEGMDCLTPQRDDPSIFDHELGHVIYSIGLTADFRQKPLDTVNAHVCQLLEVLRRGRFQSLLYLSSTRLYSGAESGDEGVTVAVNPEDSSDVYNLSKLMGEATCFALGQPQIRVARLSNVYGNDWMSDNFLTSVIRSAVDDGQIVLQTDLDSAKDYISILDVVPTLLNIATKGSHRLYNVASGLNVSVRALTDRLRDLTGCTVRVRDGSPVTSFPRINTARLRNEFTRTPANVLDSLPALIADYGKHKASRKTR